MKIFIDKKYFSLNEVTSTLSIKRKDLLMLEELGLLYPSYKDEDTLYRYYEPSSLTKIKEIMTLKNAGLSYEEIKQYYSDTINKEDINNKLTKKENDLKIASLYFKKDNVRNMYKKLISDNIYFYYEERNIFDINSLPSLINEIFVHVVQKSYILDTNNEVFIAISKDELEKITSSTPYPFKVKIGIPLIKDYKEKNTAIIKKTNSLIYEASNSNFFKEIDNLNKVLTESNINSVKTKKDIMFIYLRNSSIIKFIIPIY